MRPVVIDTDAGVDDSIAIVYASRLPDAAIELITTVSGNVPVSEVTQNVLYLKKILRLDAPVFSGAEAPKSRKLITAPEVHGEDGVGGYRKSKGISFDGWKTGGAPAAIVRAARKLGKKLTIISLGPMTNIARAVSIDPAAIKGAGDIIQMGGVFSGYGNTTVFTEFNIFVDPEAASYVLEHGVKVTFVPLDLTETLFLPRDIVNSLLAKTGETSPDLAPLLRKALNYYIAYHRHTDKLDGCFMHDPIAVAAAVHPEWFRFIGSSVSIETHGTLTAGMTVADFRKETVRGNSRIAVAFDALTFLGDLTSRVFGSRIGTSAGKKSCLRQRFTADFRNHLR